MNAKLLAVVTEMMSHHESIRRPTFANYLRKITKLIAIIKRLLFRVFRLEHLK